MHDGTRFGIVSNHVVWQQDRNGNRINYEYPTTRGGVGDLVIRDTLGRKITVSYYWPSQPTTETVLASVTYNDATGTARTVSIYGSALWSTSFSALRDGGGVPTMGEIFPTLDNDINEQIKPTLVTKVVLPSGHEYSFRYNRYAEVSRVNLPTGGRIDYEHYAGLGGVPSQTSGIAAIGQIPQIYRRVKSRSTFVDPYTTSIATKTAYDDDRIVDSGSLSGYHLEVGEKFRDAANNIDGETKHYFEGTPLDNLVRGYGEPAYSGQKPWKEGKETRTEYLDTGGQKILKAVDFEWEQWRSTWTNPNPSDKNDLHQYENNPRIKSITTSIKDGSPTVKSKVEYDFDDLTDTTVSPSVDYTFNNIKSTREYDFSNGTPNRLLRETQRTYETSQTYTTPTHKTYAESAMVHIRSLVKSETVINRQDGQNTTESTTSYAYDQLAASGSYYADLVTRTIASNDETSIPATPRHHSPYNTAMGRPYRGNVTTVTVGIAPDTQALTRMRYDVCGNLVRTYLPRSTNPSQMVYSVDYDYASPTDPGDTYYDFSFAYPSKVTRYVTETVSGSGSTKPLETKPRYYFDTGQRRKTTGENGEVTSYSYDDPLGRPTNVSLPTGGYQRYFYSSSGGDQSVQMWTKLDGSGGTLRETWTKTTYDGLGRERLSERSDVGGATISITTTYDVRGRVHFVTNPIRSTDPGAPTVGGTRTTYDAINRVRLVESVVNENDTSDSAGYTGSVETIYTDAPYHDTAWPAADMYRPVIRVIDQANKQRSSVTDGIARISDVFEAPDNPTFNYRTKYTYDARANLKSVTQGSQTARQFSYDSFGRLTQATLPECGSASSTGASTNYSYDVGSNLMTKTDPRSIQTTFTYDELNRPKSKDYLNTGTVGVNPPDVRYIYDGSDLPSGVSAPSSPFVKANTVGRLFAVITAATTSAETDQEVTGIFRSYDASGRVTSYSEMLDGQYYTSSPTYDEASLPTVETYSFPGSSNATREFKYNDAGQMLTAMRASTIVAGAATYSASGALTKERLGDPGVATSLYHTMAYNSRLQPTSIKLGTTDGGGDRLSLEYTYGAQAAPFASGLDVNQKANNGNVARINITPVPGQPYFEQDFVYDPLNRLILAKEVQTTGGPVGCGQTGTLSTPTGFSGSPSGTTANLSWTDNNLNECAYIVSRSTTENGQYFDLPATLMNANSYMDQNLTPGSYFYRVRARNDSGSSAATTNLVRVDITGGPAAPTTFSGTNVNGNQINLTWSNVTGETGYVIEREEFTEGQAFMEIVRPAADVTTYTDYGVMPQHQYQYQIKAINGSGESAWVLSNVINTTPSDWSIKLDGYDDYAATTASGAVAGLDITGTVTVEAWVIFYDKDVTDVIVSKHKQSAAEGGYLLATTNTNQLTFVTYTSSGTAAAVLQSSGVVPYKQWCHVAGVYDGTYIRVFVNGAMTELNVGSGKGAAASGSAVQLGRTLKSDGTATKFLRGKLDEVRLSNTARYSAAFTPTNKNFTSDSNTKALWKMNDGGGTTAVDSSSTPYAVTLYNGPIWRSGVTLNNLDKRSGRKRRNRDQGQGDAGGTEAGAGGTTETEANKVGTLTDNWLQEYEYPDQWGNMRYKSTSTIGYKDLTLDSASTYKKNRVLTVGGVACTYDNAGNLLTEPGDLTGQTKTYSYDAENRMWKTDITGMGAVTVKYVYDGEGRRVKKKVVNGTTTKYIYNVSGALIAEFEGTTRKKEYLYGPMGMAAVVQNPGASESIEYTTADHLGTPRVTTYGNGATVGQVISRHDYLPFGGEILPNTYLRTANGYQSTDDVKQRFTSKERDAETNLDFFGARYYGGALGRFTSTDPVVVTPERLYDPQQFSLYAYVRNNPLRFIDPTGKTLTVSGDIGEAIIQLRLILGVTDEKRIKYDEKTNTITVDLTGIDLSQNAGAALLNDVVKSANRYDLAIGDSIDTEGGKRSISGVYPKDSMANLDKNADPTQFKNGKTAMDKPKSGVADQIGFNFEARRGSGRTSSIEGFKPSLEFTQVFHELAEAYAKVEHNKLYHEAHQEAIDRERTLRDQRPFLRSYNFGSGPGDVIGIIKQK